MMQQTVKKDGRRFWWYVLLSVGVIGVGAFVEAISGTGIANTIVVWVDNQTIGNSSITDNGTYVNVTQNLYEKDSRVCTATNGVCPYGSGNLSSTPNTNYVVRWTNSSNLGTGSIFDNITNVGIGTSAVPINQKLAVSGNTTINGYLRVGSASVPVNTATGDITGVRLSLGNDGFNDDGAPLKVSGTMNNTVSAAQVFASFTNTITPPSNSSTNFRAINFANYATATGNNTLTGLISGYFENRWRQVGTAETASGIAAFGIQVDIGTSPITNITNITSSVIGIQAIGVGQPSGTTIVYSPNIYAITAQGASGITNATNLYGIVVSDNAANQQTLNTYGIDVNAQTRGANSNVGVRIAAASGGNTSNYALQLSDTGGKPNGGITFGTDTALFRSGAGTLQLNGNLTINQSTGIAGLYVISDAFPTGARLILSGDRSGTIIRGADTDAGDGIRLRTLLGTSDLVFVGVGSSYLGKVGINTSTPTSTLTVNGAVNISGKEYQPGMPGTGYYVCFNATDNSLYRNATGCP